MFFKKKTPPIETIKTTATLDVVTVPSQTIITPAPNSNLDIDTQRSGNKLIKSVLDYVVKRDADEAQFLEDLSKDLELHAALIEFDSLQTNCEVF